MRFDIEIDAIPGGDGWSVQIRSGGEALLEQPRVLRSVGEGQVAFPLPPKDEAESLEAEAIHRGLCNAVDDKLLSDAYASIVDRKPGDRGVERFGRYLFACLLGDRIWIERYKRAGEEPVELAICWRSDNRAINRLPWEMLHGPQGFLAQEANVAITRRVCGSGRRIEPLEGLPRVLFVVGSELSYDVISPGAEFVGLLRSLRGANLDVRLRSHLLLEATPNKLEAAMKWFRPNVVHFICHGEWDHKGEFFLRLMDDEKPNTPFQMRAWNLKELLKGAAEALPEMVVLNACFSANARDDYWYQRGDFKQPLAVQLIEMGVPVVVGMAGEVSDQACRLFTRRFYEALLQGEEFTQAAAEGRRAGIISKSSYNPKSNVDWSLPRLFLATELNEVRLQIPPKVLAREQQLNEAGKAYATREDYPAFCGRLPFFHWYDLLMADRNVQQATSPNKREFQMLAVYVNLEDRAKELPGDRYGRTWLLHELAAQMARDGHVPVLLTSETVKKIPNTDDALMAAIKKLALETAVHFGVDWNWKFLPELEAMKKGDATAPWLPQNLKNLLQAGSDPEARAMAFRLDLLALRDAVIQSYECMPEWRRQRTRLVLLLDDLHRYGEAAEYLMQTLLGSIWGLRGVDEIRVVGAYSSRPMTEQKFAADQINLWVRSRWVEGHPLSAFSAPEDRFVYKQFLLRYREKNRESGRRERKPLALAVGLAPHIVEWCFERIHAVTKGIPSNLKSDAVEATISVMLNLPDGQFPPILRDANDDDDLAALPRNRDIAP